MCQYTHYIVFTFFLWALHPSPPHPNLYETRVTLELYHLTCPAVHFPAILILLQLHSSKLSDPVRYTWLAMF